MGLGASSISDAWGAYIQNEKSMIENTTFLITLNPYLHIFCTDEGGLIELIIVFTFITTL